MTDDRPTTDVLSCKPTDPSISRFFPNAGSYLTDEERMLLDAGDLDFTDRTKMLNGYLLEKFLAPIAPDGQLHR